MSERMMSTVALDPDFRGEVDAFIQLRVKEGFASQDEIIEAALDYWEDPPDFDALELCVRRQNAATPTSLSDLESDVGAAPLSYARALDLAEGFKQHPRQAIPYPAMLRAVYDERGARVQTLEEAAASLAANVQTTRETCARLLRRLHGALVVRNV